MYRGSPQEQCEDFCNSCWSWSKICCVQLMLTFSEKNQELVNTKIHFLLSTETKLYPQRRYSICKSNRVWRGSHYQCRTCSHHSRLFLGTCLNSITQLENKQTINLFKLHVNFRSCCIIEANYDTFHESKEIF